MAQQSVFSELIIRLRKLYPNSVYDGALPPKGTQYPFIYLGETTEDARIVKKHRKGNPADITQTIHIWHNNPRQRGRLSGIADTIEDVCYNLTSAECVGYGSRILPDKTTAEPLLHAVITVDFIF